MNSQCLQWLSLLCMTSSLKPEAVAYFIRLCMWNIPWLFHTQPWPVRIQLFETIYGEVWVGSWSISGDIHHHLLWSSLSLTSKCQIQTFTLPCSNRTQNWGQTNGVYRSKVYLYFCITLIKLVMIRKKQGKKSSRASFSFPNTDTVSVLGISHCHNQTWRDFNISLQKWERQTISQTNSHN